MKVYIEYLNESIIDYNELNEGWKDIALGGMLILSSIIPHNALSKEKIKVGNSRIEYASTEKTLNKQEVGNIISKLIKNDFTHPLGSLPIDKDYIKTMHDGKYFIINSVGKTHTDLKHSLNALVNMEKRGRIIKIINLYKDSNSGENIEGVSIVMFE